MHHTHLQNGQILEILVGRQQLCHTAPLRNLNKNKSGDGANVSMAYTRTPSMEYTRTYQRLGFCGVAQHGVRRTHGFDRSIQAANGASLTLSMSEREIGELQTLSSIF